MSFLAANPAGFSHLSPCLVERANAGLSTRNDGGELRPSYGGHAGSNRTAIAASFRSQCADDNFALARVCRYVSRLLLGHRFGVFPAPGGTRSSASLSPQQANTALADPFARPFGVSVPPKTSLQISGTKRRANFFRAPPRKQTFGLGSRTHSLGFAQCDPSNNGKFNKRRHDYVPEQSNPHRLCRQQPRSSHQPTRSLTTLSLATKSSYKKDGKYISHTEWHRCVVFGKLAEFAKTLTKGAHIQVEGELRSREYDSKKTDSKQRVWEIRVASILKLDRAEKAAPEDQIGSTMTRPAEETAA